MAKCGGFEGGGFGLGEKRGVGKPGVFEGVVGEGVERFELGPGFHPLLHCRSVFALPIGDGDGRLCASGEQQREDVEIFLVALLDDDELVLDSFEDRRGGAGSRQICWRARRRGEVKGLLLHEYKAVGEELHLACDSREALRMGRDSAPHEECNGGLEGEKTTAKAGIQGRPGCVMQEAGQEESDQTDGGEGESPGVTAGWKVGGGSSSQVSKSVAGISWKRDGPRRQDLLAECGQRG